MSKLIYLWSLRQSKDCDGSYCAVTYFLFITYNKCFFLRYTCSLYKPHRIKLLQLSLLCCCLKQVLRDGVWQEYVVSVKGCLASNFATEGRLLLSSGFQCRIVPNAYACSVHFDCFCIIFLTVVT